VYSDTERWYRRAALWQMTVYRDGKATRGSRILRLQGTAESGPTNSRQSLSAVSARLHKALQRIAQGAPPWVGAERPQGEDSYVANRTVDLGIGSSHKPMARRCY